MLPCLECAAFRTWVMPSFCSVALFCATALRNAERRNSLDFSLVDLREVSPPHTHTQQTPQTWDTHTFPTNRLGQTSSTGVSSSVQESSVNSSSLRSARSCRWPVPDILEAECPWRPCPPSSSLPECEQLSERREQVAAWTFVAGSKISSVFRVLFDA